VRLTHGFCLDCHTAIIRDLDRMVADSEGDSKTLGGPGG
jgi:hypothetical protein